MYKNKSKYSELTAEEREKIRIEKQRKSHEEWMNRQSEEKKEEIREKVREAVSKVIKGRCETCGRDYGNIYQHRTTKKHQENEAKKTEKKIILNIEK
jgi:hypothetical protein